MPNGAATVQQWAAWPFMRRWSLPPSNVLGRRPDGDLLPVTAQHHPQLNAVAALLVALGTRCSRTELGAGPRWTPPIQSVTEVRVNLVNTCTQRGLDVARCRGLVGITRDSTVLPTLTEIQSLGGQPSIHSFGAAVIANAGRLYVRGDNSRGGLGAVSQLALQDWTEILPSANFQFVTQNLDSICAGNANRGDLWCGGRIPIWTRDPPVPLQPIVGVSRVVAVAHGEGGVCVLVAESGAVLCWGAGALTGSDVGTINQTPTTIGALPPSTAISVGSNYACAIDQMGVTRCWGMLSVNHARSVGAPEFWSATESTSQYFRQPTIIPDLPLATDIKVSRYNSCIVSTNSELWCWGDNSLGQMGDGTTLGSFVPKHAFPGIAVRQAAVGLSHICVRQGRDEIFCSGDDQYSQIGVQERFFSETPVALSLPEQRAIAAGIPRITLQRTNAVTEWNYGREQFATSLTGPQTIRVAAEVARIVAAEDRACYLSVDGRLFCWGNNIDSISAPAAPNGQRQIAEPTEIVGLGQVSNVALATRYPSTCAVNRAGALSCWGFPPTPLLDNSTRAPRVVPQFMPLRSVSVNSLEICGVTMDGRVQCTGRTNANGELGTGDTTAVAGVATVVGLSSVAEVAVIEDAETPAGSVCARTTTGEVWCWGANGSGQLGNATRQGSVRPQQIQGLSSASQLTCGTAYCCALAASQVWCWGNNQWGQLGTGNRLPMVSPAMVEGLPAVEQVVAGTATTCARTATGALYCWGRDSRGEFGEVKQVSTNTPIPLRH